MFKAGRAGAAFVCVVGQHETPNDIIAYIRQTVQKCEAAGTPRRTPFDD
jgi:hypothetical protein